MSSGSGFELELRLRKSDGSYRWFLARYNPVHPKRWYDLAPLWDQHHAPCAAVLQFRRLFKAAQEITCQLRYHPLRPYNAHCAILKNSAGKGHKNGTPNVRPSGLLPADDLVGEVTC
jgi:hypothetical protein